MPPKKLPNNGFYYLMLEHVENERARGRNIGMMVAQQEMGDIWKGMSKEEREPYNIHAKKTKMNPVGEVTKFTSDGQTVSGILTKQRVQKELHDDMINDIRQNIANLQKLGGLETQDFFLIHVNYFCVTREKTYVPAEIAIIRYNLQNGEEKIFHAIIAPEVIPPGYRFDMQSRCDDTHMIPFPSYAEDRRALAEPVPEKDVFDEMMEFLEEYKAEGKLPRLYAHPENVDATKRILQEMEKNYRYAAANPIKFRIYEFQYFLLYLKNACVDDPSSQGFPSLTSAVEEINRDVFCFYSGIGCYFHDNNEDCQDKFHYCSLSIARRLMYLVCDHCCTPLNLELLPGKHCPERADTTGNTALAMSRAGSVAPSRYASGCTSRDPLNVGSVASSRYASGCTSRDPFDYNPDDDDADEEFQQVRKPRRGAGWGRGRLLD